MTFVLCNRNSTLLYKVGSQRVNIDLKLRNRKMLNSVYRLIVLYPSCLGTIGLVYLGLLQALVVVPMLVQSCLDAFLASVVEVKGSLRASPRVLFRCCFSSRPTSRSSLAPVPLGSTIFPSDARGPPGWHSAVATRLPRIGFRPTCRTTHESSFSGPACPSFFIYCGDCARSAYPFPCYISTLPHIYMLFPSDAVPVLLREDHAF